MKPTRGGAAKDAAAKAQKPGQKTLGPVRNLEAHVPTDWWRGIFNAMYLKTDGDAIDDDRLTRLEVDLLLKYSAPEPADRVLDLCCGQGRHTLEFARRGFVHMEGLDRSHYLIQRAKVAARNLGLNVKFRQGDARKLPYGDESFEQVMILGNSFGFFESAQDDLHVLEEVRRILTSGGRLVMDIADGNWLRKNYQQRSWEWMDAKHFVCRERSLSNDGQRLISREIIARHDRGVIKDQFYGIRLYSRESLCDLLAQAGFQDTTVHLDFGLGSDRNQDLGTLEHRLLATCNPAKARAKRARKVVQPVREVAVLLGDPRQPDPVKPDSAFDEDDFVTIDRMKEALEGLPGYRFTYLDDHASFLKDLQGLAGKVDLVVNFCDEGLDNQPLKELHVPAILDIFGHRYTGAGPQSCAFCYDKSFVRGVAREMGLPVPRAHLIRPDDQTVELPLEFPVLLKPNAADASQGITQRSVANDPEQLLNALTDIRTRFNIKGSILVEEFLPGKDLSAAIIGNPPTHSWTVLPMSEENYAALPDGLPRICGYEVKWDPDSPYAKVRSQRSELPEDVEKFVAASCIRLFERLGCRDYARFDWRCDAAGNPRLLEVNPNPGWCWDGHLANMAGYAGIDYRAMLKMILRAAEERYGLPPVGDGDER